MIDYIADYLTCFWKVLIDCSVWNVIVNFIFFSTVSSILSEYGWYLVFLCMGVFLLIQHLRKIRPRDNQSSSVSDVNQGQNQHYLLCGN